MSKDTSFWKSRLSQYFQPDIVPPKYREGGVRGVELLNRIEQYGDDFNIVVLGVNLKFDYSDELEKDVVTGWELINWNPTFLYVREGRVYFNRDKVKSPDDYLYDSGANEWHLAGSLFFRLIIRTPLIDYLEEFIWQPPNPPV
jgi:hypothetical protein